MQLQSSLLVVAVAPCHRQSSKGRTRSWDYTTPSWPCLHSISISIFQLLCLPASSWSHIYTQSHFHNNGYHLAKSGSGTQHHIAWSYWLSIPGSWGRPIRLLACEIVIILFGVLKIDCAMFVSRSAITVISLLIRRRTSPIGIRTRLSISWMPSKWLHDNYRMLAVWLVLQDSGQDREMWCSACQLQIHYIVQLCVCVWICGRFLMCVCQLQVLYRNNQQNFLFWCRFGSGRTECTWPIRMLLWRCFIPCYYEIAMFDDELINMWVHS